MSRHTVEPPLTPWGLERSWLSPHGDGLINLTWSVRRDGELIGFLQRLNTDIFVPEVHEDIEAVTAHLQRRGLQTPRLLPTQAGALWHSDPHGTWRLLSAVGDRTVRRVEDLDQAKRAAALVGRFHAALADLRWEFRSVREGAHDTPAHMARLRGALQTHRSHSLYTQVTALAEEIFAGWERWQGPEGLPLRIIHGDLKISNIRFQGQEAVALVDLDTLAWGTLDVELGDAMRSWCNPSTEDAGQARFDLSIFGAAMAGYRATAEGVQRAEWESIVPGTERICLELASRFAADALEERYFGWDDTRFATRGEHNLVRARGQAALAASVRSQRREAERLVG